MNLLEGYGSNNIRLRLVDYMVFNYDCNHFHQRLLPAIYQFLSLINKELVIMSPVISVYTLRDKNSISPHMTPLFIDPLTEPKLANFLR